MTPQRVVYGVGAVTIGVLLWVPHGLPWWSGLLAVVTMQYWLGPWLIYFTQRQSRSAEMFLFEASQKAAYATTQFDEIAKQLSSFGFVEGARLSQAGRNGNTGFVQLLENVVEGIVASRIFIVGVVDGMVLADSAHFTSRLTDGRRLVTSNSTLTALFPPNPAIVMARLPSLRSLALLYRVHVWRTARCEIVRDGNSQITDPLTYQQRLEDEAKRHMVATGYWKFDARLDLYRPTLIGAFLMAFRSLQPCKWIAKKNREREELRLVKEFAPQK